LHSIFQSYGIQYALLGIFRWIFSVAFWPWVALQGYAVYTLANTLSHNESDTVQKISTIASTVALYSGMVLGFFGIQHFGQKKLKLNKIDWTRYWRSSWDAQLDLLTAALTLVVVALVIRIRQLFQWPNKTRIASYRKHLIHQLLFSLIDWLVAPFYLIVVLTYWRYSEIRGSTAMHGELAQRAEIVYVALKVLLDIPAFVLIVPMTITLWRAPALWRDIVAKSPSERRGYVLWHFGQWLQDVPFVLLGTLSVLFVWRLPSLYSRFKTAATARDRRVLAVDNFFSGLFDIPAAVMFVFIYILRWHTKEYIAEIKDKKGIEWHVITFNYFVLQVIDVPTVVLYLLLAITFYKFKRMNADLLNQQSKNKRRSIVYRYAFEMITDVLSIVAYIFLFITRWNYRMMVEETKNMNTFDKNLKLIEFMFITLLDLPAILVSALLLISWRTVNVYKYLGTEFNSRKRRKFVFNELALLLVDIPKPLVYATLYITRWHRTEMKGPYISEMAYNAELYSNFFRTLLDLPFFLMLIVTSVTWRTVSQYKELKEAKSDYQKRLIVIEQFVCVILDVLAVFAGLFVTIFVWHFKAMRAELKLKSGLELEKAIFKFFWFTIRDMPYILQTVVIVVSWRSASFRASIKGKTEAEQKHLVRMYFDCVILDPFATFALGCLYLNPWRISEAKKDMAANENIRRRQNAIIFHFFFSIVDLPFLVLYFIIAITIYRFRRTREKMAAATSVKDKRFIATEMFCCILLDVPMLIAFGFIKMTIWHVKPYEEELGKHTDFMVHIIVFKHFSQALLSLPFMLASLIVFCTGWRARELYRELAEAKTVGDKRFVAIEQLVSLFLDVFAFVAYIIVTLLFWHRNEMKASLKDKKGLKLHGVIFKFLGLTIVDLPFILMTIIVFVLLWRSKVMYHQLKSIKTNIDKRGVALIQFSLLFVDIPASLCAAVVLVTGFKAPKMIRRLKEALSKLDYNQLMLSVDKNIGPHIAVFFAFFELLIDIPFAVLFIFIIVFHWRFIIYRKKVAKLQSYWRRRLQLSKQAALVFLDIPCAVLLIVLLLSWRRNQVWKILKAEIDRIRDPEKKKRTRDELMELYQELFAAFGGLLVDVPFAVLSLTLLWRAPIAFKSLMDSKKSYEQWRGLVITQFKELLLDICFLAVAVLTVLAPWRLVYLIYRAFKLPNAQERRLEVIVQLRLSMRDFVLLIESVIIIGTLWRIVPTIKRIRQYAKTGMTYQKVLTAVNKEFVHWMKDLLVLPFFLVSLIFFWRVPIMIVQMSRAPSNYIARKLVLRHFAYGPADVLCFILGLIIVGTLWRSLRLVESLQQSSRKHKAVFKQFKYWVWDFVLIAQILFIFATINQGPSFVTRSIRFYRRYRSENRSIVSKLLGFDALRRIFARVFKKEATAVNLFDALPQEVVLQVMSYMSAKPLAYLSFCSQILKQVSDDDTLWQALIVKDFNASQLKRVKNNNYRVLYGELVTGKGFDEELHIYRQGYDYLIHLEYLTAWRRILHFFAIPFKLLGYLSYPIPYLIDINRKAISVLTYFDPTPMLITADISRNIQRPIADFTGRLTWWHAQHYFVYVMISLGVMLACDLIIIQTYLRVLVLFVISFGGIRNPFVSIIRTALFTVYAGAELFEVTWTCYKLHVLVAIYCTWWIFYLPVLAFVLFLNLGNHFFVYYNLYPYFHRARWSFNPFQGYIIFALVTRDVLAFFFRGIVLAILRVIYNGAKIVFKALKNVLVKIWRFWKVRFQQGDDDIQRQQRVLAQSYNFHAQIWRCRRLDIDSDQFVVDVLASHRTVLHASQDVGTLGSCSLLLVVAHASWLQRSEGHVRRN
jgi:hypothetical protein